MNGRADLPSPAEAGFAKAGALTATPVEFRVENLFPRTKIQHTLGNSYNHFPAHNLAFDVRIAVIFAGKIVLIVSGMGDQLFKKSFIIL